MKNLKLFVKALRKNYYKDFIVTPESELVDFAEQVLLVEYRNSNYYEKSLEAIRLRQEEITSTIKPLYKKALSDLYFDLADKKTENIYSIISFYIESLKVNLSTLQTDFFIDDEHSRYYSKIVDLEDVKNYTQVPIRKSDLDELPLDGKFINAIKKWYDSEEKIKNNIASYESFYHIGFHTRRFKVISFLPFCLWQISIQFIDDLNNIKKMIEEHQDATSAQNKIKWSGKKTHIGFILGMLALEGYIEPPKSKNGEVNYTAFSKLIKQNFDVEVGEDTLRKYLNPDDEKFNENKITFEKQKYLLPNVKLVT